MRPAWSRDRRDRHREDRNRRRCSGLLLLLRLHPDGHHRDRGHRRDHRCARTCCCRWRRCGRSSPGRASCPGWGGYRRGAARPDAVRRDEAQRYRSHPDEARRDEGQRYRSHPDEARRDEAQRYRSHPDEACPEKRHTGYCLDEGHRDAARRGGPDAGYRCDEAQAWVHHPQRACDHRASVPNLPQASCHEAWERSRSCAHQAWERRAWVRCPWGPEPWGHRAWARHPWGPEPSAWVPSGWVP